VQERGGRWLVLQPGVAGQRGQERRTRRPVPLVKVLHGRRRVACHQAQAHTSGRAPVAQRSSPGREAHGGQRRRLHLSNYFMCSHLALRRPARHLRQYVAVSAHAHAAVHAGKVKRADDQRAVEVADDAAEAPPPRRCSSHRSGASSKQRLRAHRNRRNRMCRTNGGESVPPQESAVTRGRSNISHAYSAPLSQALSCRRAARGVAPHSALHGARQDSLGRGWASPSAPAMSPRYDCCLLAAAALSRPLDWRREASLARGCGARRAALLCLSRCAGGRSHCVWLARQHAQGLERPDGRVRGHSGVPLGRGSALDASASHRRP